MNKYKIVVQYTDDYGDEHEESFVIEAESEQEALHEIELDVILDLIDEGYDAEIVSCDIVDNRVRARYPRGYGKFVCAMASVGYIGDLEVYIRSDEGGFTPHFHVWDRNTSGKQFKACVRIDIPAYFGHGRYIDLLDRAERIALDKFLREQREGYANITNWQWLVLEWNRGNNARKLDYDAIKDSQPNYRVIYKDEKEYEKSKSSKKRG